MAKKDINKEEKHFSGVIFPHSSLQEKDVKNLILLFEKITLFQPWYMGPPAYINERNREFIRIKNPSPDTKPEEEFKTLIREYKAWAGNNRDKNYTAFLTAKQGRMIEDESTWEIRQSLRGAVRQNEENRDMRRHLVLHLAQEISDQQREADQILSSLKDSRSPLQGALSEEPAAMFDDLPQFASESSGGWERWEQVFDAWFGLFGSLLCDRDILIALSGRIIENIAELADSCGIENSGIDIQGLRFKSTDLSHLGWDDLIRMKKRVLEGGQFQDSFQALLAFCRKGVSDPGRSAEVINPLQDALPRDSGKEDINFTIKYFPPFQTKGPVKGFEILNKLSGKLIIAMEYGLQ